MINQEIFQKALELAQKNGWQAPINIDRIYISPRQAGKNTALQTWQRGLILSHSFAKAFWGNEWVDCYGHTYKEYKKSIKNGMHYPINYEWYNIDLAWGHHLKNMVLDNDPIQYLSKFLPTNA